MHSTCTVIYYAWYAHDDTHKAEFTQTLNPQHEFVLGLALYTHRDAPMPCAALLASPLAIYTVDIANTPPKFAVYTVDGKICAFFYDRQWRKYLRCPTKTSRPFSCDDS